MPRQGYFFLHNFSYFRILPWCLAQSFNSPNHISGRNECCFHFTDDNDKIKIIEFFQDNQFDSMSVDARAHVLSHQGSLLSCSASVPPGYFSGELSFICCFYIVLGLSLFLIQRLHSIFFPHILSLKSLIPNFLIPHLLFTTFIADFNILLYFQCPGVCVCPCTGA